MNYLLDTNAISEPGRREPDPVFQAWFKDVDPRSVFISTLTIGELRRGLALLPPGERRSGLEHLNAEILRRFGDQLVPIDASVAQTWGDLSARLKAEGQVIGAVDELIAASAIDRGLILVSRNRRHFEPTGCTLISPWTTAETA